MEHFKELRSNGRLMALPTNIRLGWESMAVANTLAYHVTATIMAVKSFKVQLRDQSYKTFYGRNIRIFVIS